jgi:uncharacterized CHY-type Zn-finger protein
MVRKVWTSLEYALKNSAFFGGGKTAKRIFFPGCSLMAASPDLVWKSYGILKQLIPDVGIRTECCGKPLRKFHSSEKADRAAEHSDYLEGVEEIITACGNCKVEFSQSRPQYKVTSLYSYLKEAVEMGVLKLKENSGSAETPNAYKIHHPCSARIDSSQRSELQELLSAAGVEFGEEKGHALSCCLIRTDNALKKIEKNKNTPFLSYCGHCVKSFSPKMDMKHVLQLFWDEYGFNTKGAVSKYRNYRKINRLVKNQN